MVVRRAISINAGPSAAAVAAARAASRGPVWLIPDISQLDATAAAAAWGLAIGSDYSYAETEGPRPADFAQQQFSGRVFRQLCGSEPEFLVLRMRMGHMLESGMALRDGPLSARFGAAIQAAQQAQAAG